MITALGSFSVGALNPTFSGFVATASADLDAQIAGVVAASANLTATPPTLATQLTAALQLVATVQAAIAIGIPGVSFQLAALADALAALNVKLAAIVTLQSSLAAVGVSAYIYEGPCAGFAPQLGAYTNGGFAGGAPDSSSYALVLGVTDAGTWAVLRDIYGLP